MPPQNAGNLYQAGVQLVVRGAREAIRSASTFTSATRAVNASLLAGVDAATKRTTAFKEAATAQQKITAGIIKEQMRQDIYAINRTVRAGKMSKQQAAVDIAQLKVAAEQAIATTLATDATNAKASAEQLALLASARLTKQQFALSTALATVAATISVVTLQANVLFVTLAKAASRTNSLVISARYLSVAFGSTAEAATKEIAAITKMGISREKAAEAVGRMTSARLKEADATKLASAAFEFAAARALPVIDVYQALVDSVANASTETLKNAGIAANATEVFGKYGRAIGKHRDELTDLEKSRAILAYVEEQNIRNQGAFAAVAGTSASKVNKLRIEVEKLKGAIGDTLDPALGDGARALTILVSSFNNLSTSAKDTITAIAAGTTAVLGLGTAIGLVKPLFTLLLSILKGAGIAAVANPWVLAITAITAGIAATAIKINKTRQDFRDMAQEFVQSDAQRIKGAIDAITEQFEASVSAKIAAAERMIRMYELEERALKKTGNVIRAELTAIEDAFYALRLQTLNLDKPLWPLEDQLARITAATTLTLIPLNRRGRVLAREIEDLRELVELEKERKEETLDWLKEALEKQRELLDIERDRLEATQHNVLMETLRNKIFKRATSGRLLELRGEEALQRDIVAREQRRLQLLQEQYEAEKKDNKEMLSAAQMQLDAALKREKVLQREIDLEEEKRTYQQEEIELAQARQIEQRLAITQQQRALEEQQMLTQRDLEMHERREAAIRAATDAQREMIEDLKEIKDLGLDSPVIDQFVDLKAMLEQKQALEQMFDDLVAKQQAAQAALAAEAEKKTSLFLEVVRKTMETLTDPDFAGAFADLVTQAFPIIEAKVKKFIKDSIVPQFKEVFEGLKSMILGIPDAVSRAFTFIKDTLWPKIRDAILANFGLAIELVKLLTGNKPRTREESSNAQSSSFSSMVRPSVTATRDPVATQQVINNTTRNGPSFTVNANYAKAQSEASVVQDMRLLLQLV